MTRAHPPRPVRPTRPLFATLVLSAAVVTAVPTAVSAQQGGPPAVVDRARYLAAVNQMLSDLDAMRPVIERSTAPEVVPWLRERLAGMQQDLEGMRGDLNAAPPPGGPPGPPPGGAGPGSAPPHMFGRIRGPGSPPPGGWHGTPPAPPPAPPPPPPPPVAPVAPQAPGGAMAPGDFNRFLAEINRAPMAREKVEVVASASRSALFTVDQVIQVLGAIPFAAQQVDAGAIMYPRVVDRPNWYRVYSAIPFQNAREDLRKRVGDVPGGSHVGVPVPPRPR